MSNLCVYLDNCCFNRPYDSQTSPLIRLETEAKLYIQTATYNCEYNEFRNKRRGSRRVNSFISKFVVLSANFYLKENIIPLLLQHYLKSKDALHLACAMEARCEYFITTDRPLLKQAQSLKELNTVNPIDFILVLEKIK